MKITTPFGKSDVSVAEFSQQLDGVQRGAIVNDEDCFIWVEGRRPDLVLRSMPWKLERLEAGRTYRATFPPAVHEMFIAFSAGTPGWDKGIEWIDLTDDLQKRRRMTRIAVFLIVAMIGVIGATYWWFLRLAS